MKWLIWCHDRQMWWAPQQNGYTRNVERAGRYSFAEAKDLVETAHLGCDLKRYQPRESMLPDLINKTNKERTE